MRRFVFEDRHGIVAGAGGRSMISYLLDQHRKGNIKITRLYKDSGAKPHFAGIRWGSNRKS